MAVMRTWVIYSALAIVALLAVPVAAQRPACVTLCPPGAVCEQTCADGEQEPATTPEAEQEPGRPPRDGRAYTVALPVVCGG